MSDRGTTIQSVKEYYGKVLTQSSDLRTSACCVGETLPSELSAIVDQVHPEVRSKFYGCGIIAPAAIEGLTILDLGCGSGRDVYVLSKLVGARGRVIGIDMTDEQLAVAEQHVDYHTKAFGYHEPNVEFKKGFIEDLEDVGIATGSIDIVISNCVINLSPQKERVFREIFRVLKPGGELHFSDVFCDRRLPAHLPLDPVVLGECLGGAMYVEDFRRVMHAEGCRDARVLSSSPIEITNPEISRKVGNAFFRSLTIRAFKLDLEDRCEDYGQVAYYLGSLKEAPHAYRLDDHHVFEKGRPVLVCGNTAKMLSETRFSPHFKVEGDLSTHYGLFECAPGDTGGQEHKDSGGGACC